MSDPVPAFLDADIGGRLALVQDPSARGALSAYLGPDAWQEYQRLAGRLDGRHLAASAPPDLLFVPGVMGSLLQSDTKGGIWWLDVRSLGHIDDLALSSDGSTDRDADDEVAAINVDSTYEPFLTAALGRDDLGHRTFPYDWRKALTLSAGAMALRIDDMYARNGGKRVRIVAHSMGGLMTRAALMEQGDRMWDKIDRIVFLGTPHFGSPAIAGYLKNHLWGFDMLALLGRYLSRETFRSLWGVLSMLPAPRGIYPGTRDGDPKPWKSRGAGGYVHPCANFDLYDPEAWALDLKADELQRLRTVLDGARRFHERMYDAHLGLSAERLDRMAVVAGVGQETLFRLEFKKSLLGVWKHTKKERSRVAGDVHRDGDGRVPVASAALDGVTIRYVRGVHGSLPNIPAVYEAVFDSLGSGDIALPATTAEALSKHLAAGSDLSEAPALDGSSLAAGADHGLWEPEPDAARLDSLAAELDADRLPAFSRVKLL